MNFNQPSGPSRHDVLVVLWRWKWLPILGCIFGLALGVLNFARQKPIFESIALIQIVYPNAESAGLDSVASGADTVRGQSRLDESRIIKSELVINKAIEASDLSSHPKLSSMSPAQLSSWIKSPTQLSVEPAGRDASTALIEIRFRSTDAEVCQKVVDAIIAGYDDYLSDAYRKLGNEVVGVVTKAQDQLKQSYEEIAKKNADFRQKAPLVWLGDEGKNHFSEHCIEIKKSINEIDIEKGKLQSLVKHIQKIEDKGRPVEAILQMLGSDPQLDSILFRQKEPNALAPANESRPLPYSTADRRAALIDLQIKEQELLNSVGEGHPAVASTRLRIDLLNKQIVAMADAEKRNAPVPQIEPSDEPAKKLEFWKSAMQDRIAALDHQRIELQKLADENERKSKELGEYLSENNLLNKELAAAQSLLDNYTNTLNRIQILPQGAQLSLLTLTPPALGSFVSPTIAPYLLGGTAGGFILFAALAMLLDFADKSFRSPDEITQALGFPVLGHVPQLKEKKKKSIDSADSTLCTLGGPNAFGSEAFRSIRTSLYFRDTESENRVIQITSPVPGDGKSTVATNLAISIAQSGRSVLLIDADMRRPRISKLFGRQNDLGLANLLRGDTPLHEVMFDGPIENLSLIASNSPARDPAELLSGDAFSSLIESLRTKFEYIVIDTPPLLAVSDAASVAARADAVLLTVRLRRNAKPLALEASRMLLEMGVRPMGIVVNGITNSRSYEYRYGKYGYQDAVKT